MMIFLPVAFLLLACGCAEKYPKPPDYCHVWNMEATYDHPIEDIEQWAADNYSDSPNVSKERIEQLRLERFEFDINHDGEAEIFVAAKILHGTGTGPHLVFQKRKQDYFYIGMLGGLTSKIRVLPLGPDGLPRVMTLWRRGGGEYTVGVWSNDGKRFVQVSSEEIRAGNSGTEEGSKRLVELFGEN